MRFIKKLAVGAALSLSAVASQAVEIGPAPTTTSLEASRGSFATSSISVSSLVSGFGGGTIYYPTAAGQFGVIALCPGYTASSSTLSWWGPKLASWGFNVIIIDTDSRYDQPSSRASQLIAALNYMKTLNTRSGHALFGKVADREGLGGHSMGGGGTLIAAQSNPSRIEAAFPMAPWSSSPKNFSGIRAPTFILSCENDSIASNGSHSNVFYDSIVVEKAQGTVNGGSHSCVITGAANTAKQGKYGVSWFKRWVDGDTRFTPFICTTADVSSGFWSSYRNTCPM